MLTSMQLQECKCMPAPRLPQRWLNSSSRCRMLARQQSLHSSSVPNLTQQLQQQRVNPVYME
jgi:hypothetical protein